MRFRANGHHVRRSAHSSNKTEAVAFLRQLLIEYAAKARGDIPRHRYEEAVERFFSEAAITPGTRLAYRGSHKTFQPLVQLQWTKSTDECWENSSQGESRPARWTYYTDPWRLGIFRLAVHSGSAVGMAGHKSGHGSQQKERSRHLGLGTRFLTPAELDQLLAATADHIRPAVIIAAETGLRKEELFGLTLSGIDLTRREIRLDHTKSGIPRRVPLSDKAIATIKALLNQPQRPNSPYLFAKPDGSRFVDMKNGFVAARQRAGLTDFRWHYLRHTFASWFVQDGGDLYHLSRMSGHATIEMTARYGHLRTGDLHSELRRVAQNRTQEQKIRDAPALSDPTL